MSKLKVAVLFGGVSDEHDVSIKSASNIAGNIDTSKYDPVYIGINRAGAWKVCAAPGPEWESTATNSVVISPDRENHGILVQNNGVYELQHIDVIFPVIHGKMGEDGALAGLFELSGIPYVGCDITSSASCMDKSLAYVIVKNAGIPTPGFYIHNVGNAIDSAQFTYPVFVKPARSGSSFGVQKVESEVDLLPAIDVAAQFDTKVLIEEAITGDEVGCSVYGNGADLHTGEIDQIKLSHGIFAPHLEKNPEKGSENSTVTVPADLTDGLTRRVKETGKAIYKALGCKGLARVDMFLQSDGTVVLNEVNTLPGFTVYSRYPRMITAAGISISEIIDRLISLALEV